MYAARAHTLRCYGYSMRPTKMFSLTNNHVRFKRTYYSS